MGLKKEVALGLLAYRVVARLRIQVIFTLNVKSDVESFNLSLNDRIEVGSN